MSFDAGKGSGSKSDDLLGAILKQLNAMDERLRSMEGKLHIIDNMQEKVSALEASIGELGAQ
jgi:uncharacterized protein YhaN